MPWGHRDGAPLCHAAVQGRSSPVFTCFAGQRDLGHVATSCSWGGNGAQSAWGRGRGAGQAVPTRPASCAASGLQGICLDVRGMMGVLQKLTAEEKGERSGAPRSWDLKGRRPNAATPCCYFLCVKKKKNCLSDFERVATAFFFNEKKKKRGRRNESPASHVSLTMGSTSLVLPSF